MKSTKKVAVKKAATKKPPSKKPPRTAVVHLDAGDAVTRCGRGEPGTQNPKRVTCGRCLRSLKAAPKVVHFRARDARRAPCGRDTMFLKTADSWRHVTCKKCLAQRNV